MKAAYADAGACGFASDGHARARTSRSTSKDEVEGTSPLPGLSPRLLLPLLPRTPFAVAPLPRFPLRPGALSPPLAGGAPPATGAAVPGSSRAA